METWATVALVLGSNVIIALTTFFATKMQVSHSDRRFQIEQQLEQQRIIREMNENNRQRRREIRSEPLLKLRDELARMATKQDRLVSWAHRQHTRFGITEEEAKNQLQAAAEDWNTYIAGGDFTETLFLQYDTELVKRVDEILKDYRESYIDAIYYKDLKATELGKAMEVFERNKTRTIEVQELINKRLEEL